MAAGSARPTALKGARGPRHRHGRPTPRDGWQRCPACSKNKEMYLRYAHHSTESGNPKCIISKPSQVYQFYTKQTV
ncbi:unnamed protein product [Coccothraustes coccothraustes]